MSKIKDHEKQMVIDMLAVPFSDLKIEVIEKHVDKAAHEYSDSARVCLEAWQDIRSTMLDKLIFLGAVMPSDGHDERPSDHQRHRAIADCPKSGTKAIALRRDSNCEELPNLHSVERYSSTERSPTRKKVRQDDSHLDEYLATHDAVGVYPNMKQAIQNELRRQRSLTQFGSRSHALEPPDGRHAVPIERASRSVVNQKFTEHRSRSSELPLERFTFTSEHVSSSVVGPDHRDGRSSYNSERSIKQVTGHTTYSVAMQPGIKPGIAEDRGYSEYYAQYASHYGDCLRSHTSVKQQKTIDYAHLDEAVSEKQPSRHRVFSPFSPSHYSQTPTQITDRHTSSSVPMAYTDNNSGSRTERLINPNPHTSDTASSQQLAGGYSRSSSASSHTSVRSNGKTYSHSAVNQQPATDDRNDNVDKVENTNDKPEKRYKKCTYPSCKYKGNKLQRHVIYWHLSIGDTAVKQVESRKFGELALEYMKQLELQSLQELLDWCVENKCYPVYWGEVATRDFTTMGQAYRDICMDQKQIKQKIELSPPNHIAALFHWRLLLEIKIRLDNLKPLKSARATTSDVTVSTEPTPQQPQNLKHLNSAKTTTSDVTVSAEHTPPKPLDTSTTLDSGPIKIKKEVDPTDSLFASALVPGAGSIKIKQAADPSDSLSVPPAQVLLAGGIKIKQEKIDPGYLVATVKKGSLPVSSTKDTDASEKQTHKRIGFQREELPEIVDSYCHLAATLQHRGFTVVNPGSYFSKVDLSEFNPKYIMATYCFPESESYPDSLERTKLHGLEKPKVRCIFGVHPSAAETTTDATFVKLESAVQSRLCCAIGECGLDYSKKGSDYTNQRIVFRTQIGIAVRAKLPLVLHCRDNVKHKTNAYMEAVAILRDSDVPREFPLYFRCFKGSPADVQAIDAAFSRVYYGFPPNYVDSLGITWASNEIPLTSTLLESGAPFLNESPWDVVKSARKLAAVKKQDFRVVANQTSQNAYRLFNLAEPRV